MLQLEFSILEQLCAYTDFVFIIKGLRGTTFGRLLHRKVQSLEAPHIIYQKGRLSEALRISEKAIIDYPSSSMLEAERLQVRSLVLNYNQLLLRPEACHSLKYCKIKNYTSVDECRTFIAQFLGE